MRRRLTFEFQCSNHGDTGITRSDLVGGDMTHDTRECWPAATIIERDDHETHWEKIVEDVIDHRDDLWKSPYFDRG